MAVEVTAGGTMVTGEHIEVFRLLALRSRLGLEIKGLGFKGRSTSVIVREMGISTKRTKAGVYADLDAHIVAGGGPARPLA